MKSNPATSPPSPPPPPFPAPPDRIFRFSVMEHSSGFCAGQWKVSLSELWINTHTHVHPLSNRLQIVSLNSKTSFFLRQRGMSPVSKRSKRQTFFFPLGLVYFFGCFCCTHVSVLPFPFFSVIPSVLSRVAKGKKAKREGKKRNAQRLGTYALSWDANGLKSNLSRILARPREDRRTERV